MEQLYQVSNLSRTAPYRGVLKETGSWPCREIINYTKLMSYFYIWNLDKERLAKRIMKRQAEKNVKTDGILN